MLVPEAPSQSRTCLEAASLTAWRRLGLTYRTLKHVARHGRSPSRRRRAIWRSRAAFRQAVARLGRDDVAIDAGANVGDFTWPLARRGIEVHAFEPDPYAFQILVQRFRSFPNVEVHQAAVSATAGEIELFRAPGIDADPAKLSKSSSVIATKSNVDPGVAVRVAAIDLGDFVAREPRVALLKMDIEGAEVDVLERLLDCGLLNHIPYVFVETHDHKIPAIAERMRQLRRRLAVEGLNHLNLDWA